MNDSFQPLPQLEIASPCHESWGEMSGTDQSRFCSQCEKSVFNFTEMTSGEVREVLNSRESICARMRRREDGSIVTRDCQSSSNQSSSTAITRRDWFSQFFSLATMVLAMGTLVGCGKGDNRDVIMGGLKESPEIMGPEIMGDVVDPSIMGEVCASEPGVPESTSPNNSEQPHPEEGTIQGRIQVSPTDLPE